MTMKIPHKPCPLSSPLLHWQATEAHLKMATFPQLVLSFVIVALISNTNGQLKPRIRFNSEGKFKIVQFADLHYGEWPGTDRGREQDANSTQVMKDILSFEHPEFVVFTGDLITGDAILFNATQFIVNVLEAVVEGDYTWASTYGNHDNGISTTREQIYAVEQGYEKCYTRDDGSASILGLTNYYLPIYGPGEAADPPLLILWFFDSRGGFDPSGQKPPNVDESVVAWFNAELESMRARWGDVPGLAFFHIPTIDYQDVQFDMSNYDCIGLVDEAVVPQNRDTLFMEALVNSTSILTTFVGHDHGNAWCCHYQGLEICYNKHTGYGGYGIWERGARVVELTLNPEHTSISTRENYIRMEDGEMIDHFTRFGGKRDL